MRYMRIMPPNMSDAELAPARRLGEPVQEIGIVAGAASTTPESVAVMPATGIAPAAAPATAAAPAPALGVAPAPALAPAPLVTAAAEPPALGAACSPALARAVPAS